MLGQRRIILLRHQRPQHVHRPAQRRPPMSHGPRRASALAPEFSEPAVDGREADPEPAGQGRGAAFAALVGEQNTFAEVRGVGPGHRCLPLMTQTQTRKTWQGAAGVSRPQRNPL